MKWDPSSAELRPRDGTCVPAHSRPDMEVSTLEERRRGVGTVVAFEKRWPSRKGKGDVATDRRDSVQQTPSSRSWAPTLSTCTSSANTSTAPPS
ncbi:hypothetical protein B0H12DRAFT_1122296 [Mycena haematopus]|nr:hypothetical protein B0H12DRAFT_1122296 [Mycena haematopus]